jgi:hypothetical protein
MMPFYTLSKKKFKSIALINVNGAEVVNPVDNADVLLPGKR